MRRRCIVPGCGLLVATGSRCAYHKREQKAKYTGSWPATRALILERDDWRCRIRGPRCLGVATEVDHIDPHGGNEASNLRAACKPCNSGKRDREGW